MKVNHALVVNVFCFSTESLAGPMYARNSVFMSPYSVRKTRDKKECHEEFIEHEEAQLLSGRVLGSRLKGHSFFFSFNLPVT